MILEPLVFLKDKRVKAIVDGQPILRRLIVERVVSELLSPVPVDAEVLSSWGGDQSYKSYTYKKKLSNGKLSMITTNREPDAMETLKFPP